MKDLAAGQVSHETLDPATCAPPRTVRRSATLANFPFGQSVRHQRPLKRLVVGIVNDHLNSCYDLSGPRVRFNMLAKLRLPLLAADFRGFHRTAVPIRQCHKEAKPTSDAAPTSSEKKDDDEKKPVEDPFARFPDNTNPTTGEVGGPTGPEPTRFGDWERKGRVTDF